MCPPHSRPHPAREVITGDTEGVGHRQLKGSLWKNL